MLDQNLNQAKKPPALKNGRYLVTGVLGKGGNAGVYKAWDTQLRQWRAIKVLANEFIKDDEVRQRFAQEAATMARLEHDNLVRVFDISDDAYTPHIVMELCTGGSIIDWMKANGAVPPKLAVDVIRQTALGVRCAHEDGFIHRDIKPQNILITHKNVVKLTDFGIARQEDSSLTQAGATIGTYAFMAPEQRHDSTQVDERADIYSLGATLFTMLQVKTTTELFVADKGDEILEGIPDPLVDFILTACAYKPKNRYQSINELLEALDACDAQLPDDPPHHPLGVLAQPLPDGPPESVPDQSQLEDLLKSLALHDDTPTYVASNTSPKAVAPEPPPPAPPQALPYVMSQPAPQAMPMGSRPSYIDESEYEQPKAKPKPPPEPTPPPPEPVDEEVPPYQNPVVLGVAAGGVLLLTVIACLFLGANQVNSAAADTQRAVADLDRAIEASAPAVTASGDRTLESLYFRATEGPEKARLPARDRYVKALSKAQRADLPSDAKILMDQVALAEKRRASASSEWTHASQGVLGSMAIGFGLADPPPPSAP